jgi:hypothetical protein
MLASQLPIAGESYGPVVYSGGVEESEMKFNINVECTPEEARRFIGLPDVTPLNERLVEEMGNRMEQNLSLMSPEAMMQSWMSIGAQAQDAFLKLMTSAATGASRGLKGE